MPNTDPASTLDILSATVPSDMHGQRLDTALCLFLPESGIRQRRRMFETHTILVNGIPKPKGFCVRTGDTILLVPHSDTQIQSAGATPVLPPDSMTASVRIVHSHAGFAAVFKPGGMHTAHIAGGLDNSLEFLLPGLFPAQSNTGETSPILVNRLDRLTSGLVIVAFGQEQADAFRDIEDAGDVEKLYLAVVQGTLTSPLNLHNTLDTAKRKTTRVLDTPASDPLRHTAVLPIRPVTLENDEAPHTLVLASIRKGARHQIRAHLAHAGFPIAGDPLYGTATQSEGPLYLHHYHIEFSTFTATCPPPAEQWTQWDNWLSNGLVLPHS